VDAQLATLFLESRHPVLKVVHVVGGCAPGRVATGYMFASPSLERNQQVGRWQIFLDPQIPFKGIPEILRPTEVDEWE